MKKVTLILSALALVLGLSQCKKQEEPVQSGEKQHIVLTANNGNDGSKVAASFASAALNLTWEGTETITVSGGASGTLTYKSGAETPNATFEGDITIDRGGDIVFTIGSAPSSYANQTGNAEGCAAWINANNHFVGTSSYQPSGSYEVQMKLQYAVLKLDVSALGTSGLLTIAAGGETVASVANVSGIASAVFVAVPANNEATQYTFTCGDKTATKDWPALTANTFYTKQGASGPTGEAIVIEPAAPAYTFTVDSDGTTVEFAPGNLYWDGSAFRFEEDQWDYSVGEWDEENYCYNWVPSHVSHFYWSNTTDWQVSGKEPYAESYSYSSQTTEDVFFTNSTQTTANPNFQVNGETPGTWRTLSRAEWNYLLGYDPEQHEQTDSYGRPGAKGLCAWKELDEGTHKGLVILPDGTDALVMESITSTEALAAHGAVFLPAAGYRYGTGVNNVGSDGHYWSGTPYEGRKDGAYILDFDSGSVYVGYGGRFNARAVRLVR